MARHLRASPMKGMPVIVFALPAVVTAWVGWLLLTPFLGWPARRAGLIAVFVLGWGYFTLVRLDGIDGSMVAEVPFRWVPTREEKFLAAIGAAKQIRVVAAILCGLPNRCNSHRVTGPASAGPTATGGFPECESIPIGNGVRRAKLWRHPRGTGLVVFRRRWKSAVHSGTARRRRSRHLLRRRRPAMRCGSTATPTGSSRRWPGRVHGPPHIS